MTAQHIPHQPQLPNINQPIATKAQAQAYLANLRRILQNTTVTEAAP